MKKLVYKATDVGVMSDIKRIRRLLCVFCFVLLFFFRICFSRIIYLNIGFLYKFLYRAVNA